MKKLHLFKAKHASNYYSNTRIAFCTQPPCFVMFKKNNWQAAKQLNSNCQTRCCKTRERNARLEVSNKTKIYFQWCWFQQEKTQKYSKTVRERRKSNILNIKSILWNDLYLLTCLFILQSGFLLCVYVYVRWNERRAFQILTGLASRERKMEDITHIKMNILHRKSNKERII